MKHVLNIALMAVVILGLAMLEATNWGYAVLAIPAVIWAKSVLNLLHKLPVLAAAFWILVAVFAWQAALVGILFYGVLATPKAPANTNGKKSWLITSCRSANNIMPITIFLPAFIASFFYSA
ncbi:hypothetical protein [Enterobacter cloacae]|uniref:hypothetical protein n=3 Tax=Gammaproteobacteria TaxID=1236 RepID=UPI003D6F3F74